MLNLDPLADLLTRHRMVAAAGLVLLSAVALAGFFYEPPAESETDGEPRLQVATEDFARVSADAILVVQIEQSLYDPATVAALREVVRAVEGLPQVNAITWVDRLPTLNLFALADPLLPPSDASPARFAAAREDVESHPLAIGQLLSEDGRTLLMPITLDWLQVKDDRDATDQLLNAARTAAARRPEVPMRIRLTGRVPLYLAHRQAFDRNQFRFQFIAYGAVLILAAFMFRGLRAVLIVAGAPALGIFWSTGILNLFNELSNPLTNVVLPVLISMVGLTDGVHLMVYIRRERAAGRTAIESARSAIKHVGLACALTSLTTAIGFSSLLLANSEYVRGFGRACAVGVVITFVAVVTFIPLVCSTSLAHNIHRGHEHDIVGYGLKRMGWLIELVIRRARVVSGLAVVLTLLLAAVALTLRPDDRLRDSQPTGSEAYQALAHCDQALGGTEYARIVIQWPEELDSTSPEILGAVEAAEQVLAKHDAMLRHPLSIRNILQSFPGDGPLEQRMSLLELLPDDARDAFINPKTRQALITVRVQDLGIARYEPLFVQIKGRLEELEQEYDGFYFRLTGNPVSRGNKLHTIAVDLARSLGTAAVIILIVMAIVYRSLRIGLITVIPNLFPLVVTAAMLVATGQPLSLASVCSFTVCLGIAVDDTIHFLTRYQAELAVDGDQSAAIRRAFVGVGTALIMTTVVLVTGFGTVLVSDLPGHRNFAAMACSTIGAALIGDLIFLPALLVTFDRTTRSATK